MRKELRMVTEEEKRMFREAGERALREAEREVRKYKEFIISLPPELREGYLYFFRICGQGEPYFEYIGSSYLPHALYQGEVTIEECLPIVEALREGHRGMVALKEEWREEQDSFGNKLFYGEAIYYHPESLPEEEVRWAWEGWGLP